MNDGPPGAPQDRLTELRGSAKGWHGIQLAALGFIGLCGVIQTGDAADPWTLQVLSGVLVLVAFVLACAGIYLVGRAAWPLYGAQPALDDPDDTAAVARASGQLRGGLLLTFLSIAALALATATSWWPQDEPGGGATTTRVQVQTSDGRTACGELADPARSGTVRLRTDSQQLDVPTASLASITPVGSC